MKEGIFKNFLNNKYINIFIIMTSIIICVFIVIITNRQCNQNYNSDEQPLKYTESCITEDQLDDEDYIKVPDKTEDYNKAYIQNHDTVGWLYIPGTTIDYPVMKGVDNNDYLRKNEQREYAFDGCIFGDDDSVFAPFKKLSNNLVIHGHNLDDNPDGKRFAQLVKFQNMEFAEKTPYIFLTTADSQLVYAVYAVYFTDVKFGYNRTDLNKDLQQIMIDSAKKRSEYIYDVYVTGIDKIITLSTCTYKYGPYGSVGQKNTRFVIQGKLLNKKDKLKAKASIEKNINPQVPNIY